MLNPRTSKTINHFNINLFMTPKNSRNDLNSNKNSVHIAAYWNKAIVEIEKHKFIPRDNDTEKTAGSEEDHSELLDRVIKGLSNDNN